MEVGRNTLQLSTCPVLKFRIQLSDSGFLSRSGQASTGRNRPAWVRNTRDQSRHAVPSTLKLPGRYLAANAPNPNRPSSAPGASCTWALPSLIPPVGDVSAVAVPSARFIRFLQHLTGVPGGLQELSRLFSSFFALPQSFAHFHHLLDQGRNLCPMISGQPRKRKRARKVPLVFLDPFCLGCGTSSASMSFLVSLCRRLTSRAHSTHAPPCSRYHVSDVEKGLAVKTCENVSHNTLVQTGLKTDVDMAAARRTLPSDHTAQAKAVRSRPATKTLPTLVLVSSQFVLFVHFLFSFGLFFWAPFTIPDGVQHQMRDVDAVLSGCLSSASGGAGRQAGSRALGRSSAMPCRLTSP